MTIEEKRHWKRYKVQIKLYIVATGEEFICETVDISDGGLQVKFSDSHNLKVNDICKVLAKVHETEVLEIDFNSSSNDLVSVTLDESASYKDHLTASLQVSDAWEELPVLAAITWIKGSNLGLEFEEPLLGTAMMPNWFKEAFSR